MCFDAAYLPADVSSAIELALELVLWERLLVLTWVFLSCFPFLSLAVRKGYRIQADKDRDSMKVLYYVEKELAQFDPARRMRERCEKQAWFDFFSPLT